MQRPRVAGFQQDPLRPETLDSGLLANGSFVQRGHLELKTVGWRKGLRGSAKNPLEFAAEVRLAGKFQFSRGGFVRVSLRDQFFCQLALQVAQPMARGAIEIAPENPLQLPLGNGAERGHSRRIKVCFPRQLLPFLLQNSSVHRTSLSAQSVPPLLAEETA